MRTAADFHEHKFVSFNLGYGLPGYGFALLIQRHAWIELMYLILHV
jgi:hypothetical protein